MIKLSKLEFIDLLELVNRQKLLDEKFKEKNKNNTELRERNRVNTLIALNTELGEIMQDTKIYWNYWKINCKFDKEHTLEEISDYLHFLLQFIYSNEELMKEVEERNEEFNSTFNKHIELLLKENRSEHNIENSLLYLSLPVSYELLGIKLEVNEIFQLFSALTVLINKIGSNWNEFLEVHHKKFELNYSERTKEVY